MFSAGREETLPEDLADIVGNRVAAAIAYRDEIVRENDIAAWSSAKPTSCPVSSSTVTTTSW